MLVCQKLMKKHPFPSESEIDTVLHDYAAQGGEYSKQAANTVVRYLKLLSEYLNEPLIVSLA